MPSDPPVADPKPRKSDEKADRWGVDSFPASDAPAQPHMTGFIATEHDEKDEAKPKTPADRPAKDMTDRQG
jgi:hypothetical protein